MNPGKNPKRGTVTQRVENKSSAQHHFVCGSVLWIFFPEIALGPKKWHIFLCSAAYFSSYWHMPFQISIIK